MHILLLTCLISFQKSQNPSRLGNTVPLPPIQETGGIRIGETVPVPSSPSPESNPDLLSEVVVSGRRLNGRRIYVGRNGVVIYVW
ncbi:hypothetical protein ACF0H5_022004 [Mactra antiquata]